MGLHKILRDGGGVVTHMHGFQRSFMAEKGQRRYSKYLVVGYKKYSSSFDVFLTVHLSIFILVIKQLDAQNLFYNKFISCLWYHHTYRCDDTRGCIIQFLTS